MLVRSSRLFHSGSGTYPRKSLRRKRATRPRQGRRMGEHSLKKWTILALPARTAEPRRSRRWRTRTHRPSVCHYIWYFTHFHGGREYILYRNDLFNFRSDLRGCITIQVQVAHELLLDDSRQINRVFVLARLPFAKPFHTTLPDPSRGDPQINSHDYHAEEDSLHAVNSKSKSAVGTYHKGHNLRQL